MRDYFSILPCKVQLQIEYINKRRVQSTRIVDVQSFVANSPDGMMVGFCHTRKMARSFSYSGITSATDTQSGEIIEPARLFLYLLAAHNSTPDFPALTDAHLKAYQPPQARRPPEFRRPLVFKPSNCELRGAALINVGKLRAGFFLHAVAFFFDL